MTTPIRKELGTLKTLAKEIAARGGAPDVIATQEVKQAFKDGTITKAQRDVLTRALSESDNSVSRVQRRLDSYADVFDDGDINKNGRSDRAEQKQWNAAYDEWAWKGASTRSDPVEIAALREKTLKMKTVHDSGKVTSSPLYGAGTLLKKLDALIAEKATAAAADP